LPGILQVDVNRGVGDLAHAVITFFRIPLPLSLEGIVTGAALSLRIRRRVWGRPDGWRNRA
jgi:hypothetical protein